MEMSIKKRIFLIVMSSLLLVTVSYAWINDVQQQKGRYMTFLFNETNKGVISSGDLEVSLYYDTTGEDDFKPTNDVVVSFEDFAPGDRKKFRADIKNVGTTPMYLRMFFSNISCEAEAILDFVDVGTSSFANFPDSILTPALVERNLGRDMSAGSVSLVDNLEIPPDGQTVSIYFYVMFSRSATDDTSGTTFTIGSVNFAAI